MVDKKFSDINLKQMPFMNDSSEQVREREAEQQEWKAKLNVRGHMSAQERTQAYLQVQRRSVELQIERLVNTHAQEEFEQDTDLQALHQGLHEKLAWYHAKCGDYLQAAETSKIEAFSSSYEEHHFAVVCSDTLCTCEGDRVIERYAYSQKHQQMMPFVRCTVCNSLNCTAILPTQDEPGTVRDI